MKIIVNLLLIFVLVSLSAVAINAQTQLTPINVNYDNAGIYFTATATLYGQTAADNTYYVIDVRGFDGYFDITVTPDTASIASTSTETDSLLVTVYTNAPMTNAEFLNGISDPSQYLWNATAWTLNFDGQTASSKLAGIDWNAESTYRAYIPKDNSIGKCELMRITVTYCGPDTIDVAVKIFGWRKGQ